MASGDDSSLALTVESLEDLIDLPLPDLRRYVYNLEEEVKHFKQENEIFESFLNANESTLIVDMENVLKKANAIQKSNRSFSRIQFQLPALFESDTTFRSTKSFRSLPRPSEVITTGKGPRVNLSQKTDLVLRQIEDIQISYEKFIKKSKKAKFNFRAELEELRIRSEEVQEASDAFEKLVATQFVDEIIQKIPAEKFVRYMQDWLKNAQIALEKLRLHTISFKLLLTKLKSQKTLKMDLGASVDVADLEKMEIQKVHMLSEIRQKNANLLEIKHMNSKANMLLINHKKLLQKQHEKKKEIQTTLEDLQNKIDILIDAAEQAEEEIERETKRLSDLKRITEKYQVPPVMEYIHKKAELCELKRELKIWRRRQQVQDIGLTTYTKMMFQLVGARKARQSWYGRKGRRQSVSTWEYDEHAVVDVEVEEEECGSEDRSESNISLLF